MKARRPRSRVVYALLGCVVAALGLASRWQAVPLPPFLRAYAGDALWALLVFLAAGWLLPSRPTAVVGLLAALFAVLVEVSQLYHVPWIDAVRRTAPGALVLGDSFAWSDLACYAAGIACGAAAEAAVRS